MWPLWFVISNFCDRFFLLLKPQDNVKFAQQISIYPHTSEDQRLRLKHWEVIPSKLWWSASVQVWGTHLLQEHELGSCSTALGKTLWCQMWL